MTPPGTEEARQHEHFEFVRNQYPRAAVLDPPVHTDLEIMRIERSLSRYGIGDRAIVDFGAGTGRLTVPLVRAGYSVIAVDLSRSSLDVLDGVARELGLGHIETRTELPSGPVSAVVGCDVLHHVDIREYLPRLADLLEPGGKAVFSEPGAFNPAWYVYLAARHDLRVETRIVSCNLASLRRHFRRSGFRQVTITGVGVLPRPFFGWSVRACRAHDAIGNWPGVRWCAYRYLIDATK